MRRSAFAPSINPWVGASTVISLVVLVPVLVVVSAIGRDSGGAWAHLAQTRLADYVTNTAVLGVGVSALAVVLGVPTAWLVTMYRFPGRGVLAWALLLPLAVPAYVSAYALTDLFQVSGPVQTWLRGQTGLELGEYWFPEARSLPGAMFILAFALYPYVYFAARIAFLEISQSALEASRTLGRGPVGTFLRVALPLARPSLVAAVLLVLMETLADFGAVEYCAVDTFATGIYRTWYGLDSQTAAAQLSSVLLVVVFVLILIEGATRRHKQYHRVTTRCGASRPARLGPASRVFACAACTLPIVFGFLLPASRLGYLAVSQGDRRALEVFAGHGANTILLASAAAVIAVVLAVVVVFAWRLRGGFVGSLAKSVCRAGYALPGPVVAIGVLIALGWADHALNDAYRLVFGGGSRGPGLVFTGSVLAVIVGYQTRFLAVALALVEGSFARVNRRVDDAARTLGASPSRLLLRVHLPAVTGGVIAAGVLVFVDVAKELPVTLMLRPFNFDTLAVRVYQLASDERLEEASTGALALVALGFLPVIILARQIERRRPHTDGATS